MAKYPYISEKKCKNCSCEIIIKRSRDKNNLFCGSGCVGKYLKTKPKEYVSCNYCKNEFIKSSKSKNLFCSVSCSNKSKVVEYIRFCEKCNKKFIVNNIAEINRGGNRFCSVSCSSRRYNFDENYFDTIDTQNKAYVLGLLYSDGCISKKKTEMIIKLHNKDKIILEEIKEDMKSEHPIKSIIQKNREEQFSFRVSSIKLCKQLISLGVTPNKTLTIKFPELDREYIRHFIRGYFDGDGCISKVKNSNSYIVTIFTASKDFKNSFIEYIEKEIGITTNVYERNNGYAMCFYKKVFILKLYEYFYIDSTMFLDRKKVKFPKS